MEIKYHNRVHEFSQKSIVREDGSLPPFTFGQTSKKGANASYYILRYLMPIITFFLRKFVPVFRWKNIVVVSRRADIEHVLNNDNGDFPVPYGPEMRQLGGGGNNILSVDGDEHEALKNTLQSVLYKDDIQQIANWVEEDAIALLDAGNGNIDVIRDLITRTATESCCRFFGLYPPNPVEFSHWSMAVSNQLFADPFLTEETWTQAQIGAAHLRAVIQDSIDRVHNNDQNHPTSTRKRITLIDRMVSNTDMSDADIVATIIGMMTAFIPTDTLAASNMLDIIMSKSDMMVQAKQAAKTGDRTKMREIVLEAGRLNPALNPGLFRQVARKTTICGKTVTPEDTVLILLASGLRDNRHRNKPKTPDAWLMFGFGPHACLGAELSLAHIISVFMALFSREDLHVARGKTGKLQKIGAFPDRLDFTYQHETPRGGHVIMTFKSKSGLSHEDIANKIGALENPTKSMVRDSFWKESDVESGDHGRVQFCSMSAIEVEAGSDETIIIFEINGDGTPECLLDYVSAKCGEAWLVALISSIAADAGHLKDSPEQLPKFLKSHINTLHFNPWGSTGLLFDGLPGLSVKNIQQNAQISDKAREIVNNYLTTGYYRLETKASHILRRTKRVLARDNFLMLRKKWRDIVNEKNPNGYDLTPPPSALLKPSRSKLPISDWTPPKSLLSTIVARSKHPSNRPIPIVILLSIGAIWFLINFFSEGYIAFSFFLAILIFITLSSFIALAIKLKLNHLEATDFVDNVPADYDHVLAVTEHENPPDHLHNHIIAIMPFKKGLFRRFSFAIVMWGILQYLSRFRPGFVLTMGTIHAARWFRVKGTNVFAFLANYDGSWENYLEDFITRANRGQTAAWSHGVGFPKTRNLILEGAEDGDNFKRWVRKQQRPTLFWYSRFNDKTAEQIRRDAMIVDGLSKSVSDTDAKRWLAYFGSEQRQSKELESHEIQSLVFTGYPKQNEADIILIKLPEDPVQFSEYLRLIAGIGIKFSDYVPMHKTLPIDWINEKDGEQQFQLPLEARIRFGEAPIQHGGINIGFTSAGLMRAGLEHTGVQSSFPFAFREGMNKRAKILGDDLDTQKDWRFSDDANLPQGAEAVILIYGGQSKKEHKDIVENHKDLLSIFGGHVVHHVPCQPVSPNNGQDPSLKFEHFGFRDGISQPCIRGTAIHKSAPDRDVIEPGEFILGYKNHQGYVSPPISLGAIFDTQQILSNYSPDQSGDFPYFGMRSSIENKRDFGRNGSFLVLRQLDQNVSGFHQEMEDAATTLRAKYSAAVDELAGGRLNADWVAAKVIGRWKDGTPLVGNTTCPMNIPITERPENDFTYGADDPRGFACPLGSHIRRTNPRDSLEPNDKAEQRITNRHRLLRRGRSYEYNPGTDEGDTAPQKGLLFMSICSDLSRQFEFVQRTWINKTSFHGLQNESDPLMGGPAGQKSNGAFSIPTPSGPLEIPNLSTYVSLQGGGYFFLPSRASLAFLIKRSENDSDPI